jgi:uncharacterized protein YegL
MRDLIALLLLDAPASCSITKLDRINRILLKIGESLLPDPYDGIIRTLPMITQRRIMLSDGSNYAVGWIWI